MRQPIESPVGRHLHRIRNRRSWFWAVTLLLAGCGVAGAVVRHLLTQLPARQVYQPDPNPGWLSFTFAAAALVLPLWTALRAASLLRGFRESGLLAEYRRTRLRTPAILGPMAQETLLPVLPALAAAFLAGIVAGRGEDAIPLPGLLQALAVAAGAAVLGAGWGMLLGTLRARPVWGVLSLLAVLACAVFAVGAIDPWLRPVPNPGTLIYWALVPNGPAAAASALGTDVLRLEWVYPRVHAHEYYFVYPPGWLTAAVHAGAGVLLLLAAGWRVARHEEI